MENLSGQGYAGAEAVSHGGLEPVFRSFELLKPNSTTGLIIQSSERLECSTSEFKRWVDKDFLF